MLKRWKTNPYISPDFVLIEQAVERYLEGDFISATSILYTRIEGVMRRVYHANNPSPTRRVKSAQLADSAVQSRSESNHPHSLLLPTRFNEYLRKVYFAGFAPGKPTVLSRNSVAHGVADPSEFSLKAATIGLLTLDQIFFFLPKKEVTDDEQETK